MYQRLKLMPVRRIGRLTCACGSR